jgi:Cof subfamily protein (haloacid dehalogenase superfamily)
MGFFKTVKKLKMPEDLQKRLRKVKLVATDLDGTLLDRDNRISHATKSLIKRLRDEHKILFAVLTGRIHPSAEPYLEELQLDTPLVSLNGSVVRFPRSDKYLYHTKLPAKSISTILELVSLYEVDSALVKSDRIICNGNRNAVPSYLGVDQDWTVNVSDYEDREENVVEVVLSGPFQAIQEIMRSIRGIFRDKISRAFYPSSQRSGTWHLELKPNGITKATGLDYIRKYYNIGFKEIAAIGDFYNDIDFCRISGVAVAMKNAVEELKAIADYITEHAHDSGGMEEFLTLLLESKRNEQGA